MTDGPQRKRKRRRLRSAAAKRLEVTPKVQAEVAEAIRLAESFAHLPINWEPKTVEACGWDNRGYLRWLLPTASHSR
jgi:hypothetical protein